MQFPHAVDHDLPCCVGCQRGGFFSYNVSTSCHSRPGCGPDFLVRAHDLLRRAHSKCDHLIHGCVSQDRGPVPHATQAPTMHEDWGSSPSLQTISDHTVLEALVGMDQKLANIQQRVSRVSCEPCRQKKVKCSRSTMGGDGRTKRIRQRRSFSGPFRTLLPVEEEPADACRRDNEVETVATT